MMLDAKGNYLRKPTYDRLPTIWIPMSTSCNWQDLTACRTLAGSD
ncbi:hypothetical protein SAMN05446635_7615 [Burkholderia sp. OK233]|nr:hypothetical protein SAMN05446635_7615 [Burkholderia sp. OK233]